MIVIDGRGKAHVRGCRAAGFGIEEGELGGDLDTAATAGVEVGVENVRAGVRIMALDQREMVFAAGEGD